MSVERQSREGRQLGRVGPRWAFLSSVFKQLIGGAHGRKFLTEHNGAELIPEKSDRIGELTCPRLSYCILLGEPFQSYTSS